MLGDNTMHGECRAAALLGERSGTTIREVVCTVVLAYTRTEGAWLFSRQALTIHRREPVCVNRPAAHMEERPSAQARHPVKHPRESWTWPRAQLTALRTSRGLVFALGLLQMPGQGRRVTRLAGSVHTSRPWRIDEIADDSPRGRVGPSP